MPDISPIDLAQPGPAAGVINAVKAQIGSVPNIFATMAQSPAVLEGFLAFSGALGAGVLNASVREQIALTVAGENGCDYCASAHTMMAKAAGVSAEEAALNLTGMATDSKIEAILGFTQAVVRSRGLLPPGNPTLERVRHAGVSEAELVEILAHIGLNLFTNYFNHVAKTEIDFPAINATQHKQAA